jgi:CubicO group peptidase (beta-lactamase class C family)
MRQRSSLSRFLGLLALPVFAVACGAASPTGEPLGTTSEAIICSINTPPGTPCTVGGGKGGTLPVIEYEFTSSTDTTVTINFTTPRGAQAATVNLSGITTPNNPILATSSDSPTTSHTITLTHLTPGSLYRYGVVLAGTEVYWNEVSTNTTSTASDLGLAAAVGANLDAALTGHTIGYAWAIYQFGNLLASNGGGWAVLGTVHDSATQRITAMSMSKTITATAVMKALQTLQGEGSSITLDSLIFPYLPQAWKATAGPYVNQITFRDLLDHTAGLRAPSGFAGDPDTYAGLSAIIAQGATSSTWHAYSYLNGDFCLFRVILPYLVNGPGAYQATEANGTNDVATGEAYVSYVRNNVFAPIGLGDVNVVPTGPQPYTRYYNFANPSLSVADPTDDTAMLRTGAGYWFLSVSEYGHFIQSLQDGLIISAASYEEMRDTPSNDPNDSTVRPGMYALPSLSVFRGFTYDHNGGYPGQANGAGAESDWMTFPNGMTVVMSVNSRGGLTPPGQTADTAPQTIVELAFRQAAAAF